MNKNSPLTLSMFNIYCHIDKNTVGIYNTLHDSALLISKEYFKNLPNNINNEKIKTLLINEKVLFDSSFDERLYFRYFINKLKYSPQQASFTLLLTTDCNLACKYCFEGLTNNTVYMSEQTANDIVIYFQNILKIHTSLTNIVICFYGGEPLLNRAAMSKICKKLSENNDIFNKINFTITSNLSLLKDEDIEIFNKYNFLNVQVALDGPQSIHDKRRCTKDGGKTYSTIINNIQRLVDNQISTMIILNYDQENYLYMDDLIDDLKLKLPYKKLIFFLNPIIKSFANQNCKELFMTSEFETDLFIKLYKKLRKNKIPIEAFGQRDMVCMATSDVSCTIDPLGNLFKCGLTVCKPEYKIGTIHEDIYTNLNYRFILDETWFDCLEVACPYLPICGGGCRGLSLIQNSSLSKLLCEKKEYYEKVFKYILRNHFKELMKKGCEK